MREPIATTARRAAGPAILAALLCAAAASAQERGQPPVASVTIVHLQSLGPGVRAVVHRSGSPTRNLILTSDSTTAGDLATALAVLRDSRERNGEQAGGTLIARVPDGEEAPLRLAAARRLQRELDRVRAASPRDVPGIGSLPAIEMPLPPLVRHRG